ncbi:hypothetical protein BH20ACT17_BH20ACT17_06250 [soil metagenome]
MLITNGATTTRSFIVKTATAVILLFAFVAAPAAADYPDPLPDFSHSAAPHNARMSTASGTRSRPLLVIIADFSDVTERITVAQASTRFFAQNSFGGVRDYYNTESSGRLDFTPAAETEGTANDGIITAPMGLLADIETDGGDLGGAFGRQAITKANSTDSWINFKSFDTNNDNVVDERELAIVVLTDTGDTSNCGGTRSMGAFSLDTVSLNREYSFAFALENNITDAHELAHQALATQDQNYSAGPYDITAPTCSTTGAQLYFSFNSWHKLHLGWAQPQVVTRDGYYDVPTWTTSGKSFLLYDHDRGANDYFLVENRQRGGYDQNIRDTGMAIWRIDDWAFNPNQPTYNLVRADGSAIPPPGFYSGSPTDLFNPADSQTPARTMTQPWKDGTPSRVAVRAIGNSGATMRAYLDVRGPGVLVDTYELDPAGDGTADLAHLSPGDANELEFPVMNTGEAADSFQFTVTDLPAGWTATSPTATLQPGQQQQMKVQVTPAPGARADTTYALKVRGASTSDGSVSSTSPLRVRVLPKLSIDDVTVTEGDSGTQDATFTASLSEASDRSVRADFETADGTATAPSDYAARDGSLLFSAGETSRTITVSVQGDTAVEPDEQFFVRLSDVSGAKLVDGEGRGTILTDPEPSLSIDDVRIEEHDANATFTVALSEANNTPVSVDFKTSDATATAPGDYSATNGSLDFPVGQTRRTIAVPIKEDVVDEIDEETFKVTLSNVVHATIADGDGVGTIRDDDRNGVFSCRATGVRLGDSERGVANPPRTPCRDDRGSGLPLQLGSGLLSVSSATGSASTDQQPDDLTGTQPQIGDRATAHAEASSIVIRVGVNVIRLSGFVSDARTECIGSGPPRLTAGSRVTVLAVGGSPVLTTTAATTIPLLFATLRLNQTVVDAKGITQRALVVDNVVGPDIVLGEARAGFDGTAVHPGGHPCVV